MESSEQRWRWMRRWMRRWKLEVASWASSCAEMSRWTRRSGGEFGRSVKKGVVAGRPCMKE
jgi:hypothetical protein